MGCYAEVREFHKPNGQQFSVVEEAEFTPSGFYNWSASILVSYISWNVNRSCKVPDYINKCLVAADSGAF